MPSLCQNAQPGAVCHIPSHAQACTEIKMRRFYASKKKPQWFVVWKQFAEDNHLRVTPP